MFPIQTHFNGRHYRSRLEARYAVLFQLCDLPFQYEREGFQLGRERYLPDFWLPTSRMWFEVKGWPPSQREKDVFQALADDTQRRVIVACGVPEMETILGCFSPEWDGIQIQTLSVGILNAVALTRNRIEITRDSAVVPLRAR